MIDPMMRLLRKTNLIVLRESMKPDRTSLLAESTTIMAAMATEN